MVGLDDSVLQRIQQGLQADGGREFLEAAFGHGTAQGVGVGAGGEVGQDFVGLRFFEPVRVTRQVCNGKRC